MQSKLLKYSSYKPSEREVGDIVYSAEEKYCIQCETICRLYEQGLCCDCGKPWETEVMYDEDYPDKWIDVSVEAKVI